MDQTELPELRDPRAAALVRFFEDYHELLKKTSQEGIWHLIRPEQERSDSWQVLKKEVKAFIQKLDRDLGASDDFGKAAKDSIKDLQFLANAMKPKRKVSRLLEALVRENKQWIARENREEKKRGRQSGPGGEGKPAEAPETGKAGPTGAEGEGKGGKAPDPRLLDLRILQDLFFKILLNRNTEIWINYHRLYWAALEKRCRALHGHLKAVHKALSGPGFRSPSIPGMRDSLIRIQSGITEYLEKFRLEKARYAGERGKRYSVWLLGPLCSQLEYCFPRAGRSKVLEVFADIIVELFPEELYKSVQATLKQQLTEKLEGYLASGQDKALRRELADIDRSWTERLGPGHRFQKFKPENREQFLAEIRSELKVRESRPRGRGIPKGQADASKKRWRKGKYGSGVFQPPRPAKGC